MPRCSRGLHLLSKQRWDTDVGPSLFTNCAARGNRIETGLLPSSPEQMSSETSRRKESGRDAASSSREQPRSDQPKVVRFAATSFWQNTIPYKVRLYICGHIQHSDAPACVDVASSLQFSTTLRATLSVVLAV